MSPPAQKTPSDPVITRQRADSSSMKTGIFWMKPCFISKLSAFRDAGSFMRNTVTAPCFSTLMTSFTTAFSWLVGSRLQQAPHWFE
jgi:hypothetical protein